MAATFTIESVPNQSSQGRMDAKIVVTGAPASLWLKAEIDSPGLDASQRVFYTVETSAGVQVPETSLEGDQTVILVPDGGWVRVYAARKNSSGHTDCTAFTHEDSPNSRIPFNSSFTFTSSHDATISITVLIMAVEAFEVITGAPSGCVGLQQLSVDGHLSITPQASSQYTFQYALSPTGDFQDVDLAQVLTVASTQTVYFRAKDTQGNVSTYAAAQNPTLQDATLLFAFGEANKPPSSSDTQVTMEVKENNFGGGYNG